MMMKVIKVEGSEERDIKHTEHIQKNIITFFNNEQDLAKCENERTGANLVKVNLTNVIRILAGIQDDKKLKFIIGDKEIELYAKTLQVSTAGFLLIKRYRFRTFRLWKEKGNRRPKGGRLETIKFSIFLHAPVSRLHPPSTPH